MYKCIAKIFKCFVPMFESLFRTMDPVFKYIDIRNGTDGYEPPSQSDRGGMESDTKVIRPVYVPTLPEHFEPSYESAKPVSLRGRNLQVIVKLTNIQLTPSKPKYDEGNWHNEVQLTNRLLQLDCITTTWKISPHPNSISARLLIGLMKEHLICIGKMCMELI
ncbi:hypothetical protein RTP6_7781 [Batrachochytrium dendrobatidis]